MHASRQHVPQAGPGGPAALRRASSTGSWLHAVALELSAPDVEQCGLTGRGAAVSGSAAIPKRRADLAGDGLLSIGSGDLIGLLHPEHGLRGTAPATASTAVADGTAELATLGDMAQVGGDAQERGGMACMPRATAGFACPDPSAVTPLLRGTWLVERFGLQAQR